LNQLQQLNCHSTRVGNIQFGFIGSFGPRKKGIFFFNDFITSLRLIFIRIQTAPIKQISLPSTVNHCFICAKFGEKGEEIRLFIRKESIFKNKK
jgi:hypothetical protein